MKQLEGRIRRLEAVRAGMTHYIILSAEDSDREEAMRRFRLSRPQAMDSDHYIFVITGVPLAGTEPPECVIEQS